MALVRMLARPLLAAPFIFGGFNQLRSSGQLAPKAAPVTDRLAAPLKLPTNDPNTLVKANGAAMVAGAILLATGKAPRVASTLLSGLLIPTTLAGHAFWEADTEEEKRRHLVSFVTNLGLLGGLITAAVDTAGKPGLPYRAGMAKNAIGRAAHTTALEARLAAANAQNKLPV